MKTFTLLLATLILTACSHSATVPEPTPTPVAQEPAFEHKVVPVVPSTDWQEVSGDGFTFSVPKGFTQDTSGGIPVWVAPDRFVEVSMETHPTDKKLAEYVSGLTEELTNSGISVVDQRPGTLAGHKAIALACAKGSAFLLSFVMIHDKKAFQFVCGLPVFAIKDKAPICLESAATVKLAP